MSRTAVSSAIGVVGLVGVALAALSLNPGPDRPAHGHRHHANATATPAHSDRDVHDHGGMISLPDGPTAPTLGIEILRDPMSGWNLRIDTTNFRFAPESASGPHRPGEGHAHAYVNGEKLARVYGSWFHIASLPPGRVDLTVTLNSNDHRALAVDGAPLEITRTITVD